MNIHIHVDIYEGAINYLCKENKNWKNLVGRYAFAKRTGNLDRRIGLILFCVLITIFSI